MLPWWVRVALAAVPHLVLHSMAGRPFPVDQPTQSGGLALSGGLARRCENTGQYIIPILCLDGVGISVWRRREGQNLMSKAAGLTPTCVGAPSRRVVCQQSALAS